MKLCACDDKPADVPLFGDEFMIEYSSKDAAKSDRTITCLYVREICMSFNGCVAQMLLFFDEKRSGIVKTNERDNYRML